MRWTDTSKFLIRYPKAAFTNEIRAFSGILAAADPKGFIVLLVATETKDINRMQRDRGQEEIKEEAKLRRQQEQAAGGRVSGWRGILALSLQAFAAGAKSYGNAYSSYANSQAARTRSVTCYTNFMNINGPVTNCYPQ